MEPNDHDGGSKRPRLAAHSPAGSPTIDRHVTADYGSPIVRHHSQNEAQHPNNSDKDEDDASCSQRLLTQPPDVLINATSPVLYARAEAVVSLPDIPQR